MNFETKYLIRWGIPGWIMVMVLLPYFVITYFDTLSKHVANSSDLLATGAVLTVLGVPLGYLLNQIHHSLFWVLKKYKNNGWRKYFEEEIKIDKYFAEHKKGAEKKERYRYLLSRKHELGGITMSLGISSGIVLFSNLLLDNNHLWSRIYFTVVIILFALIWWSRLYSSINIEKYHDYLLAESNEEATE